MRILTHIQNQLVELQCAQGRQKIAWLAESALHRIDPNNGQSLGAIAHVKLADGTILNSNSAIADTLTDSAEVWVVLKGTHYADELGDSVRGEESKAKSSARSLRSTSRSKK